MNQVDPISDQVPPISATPPPVDPIVVDPPEVDPAFKRVKDDLFKQKQRAQELEDENKRLKEEKLRASKNWEEIAKMREQEAQEAKTRLKGYEDALVEKEKIMALRAEAIKAGIHQNSISDLDLLDFPEIDIETTSNGKIIVHGAAQAVAALKQKRPHWFTAKPASVNPATPETISGTATKMTVSDVVKLQKVYQQNASKENKQKYEDALRALQS